MPKVIVIYYSETGNTEQMSRIIRDAIEKERGIEVEIKKVEDTVADELLEADGIIIGSPTYYGTMAWQVKKLLDESVKFHGKLDGKVGGAFTSSACLAGGNETTIMDILKALLIHGMVIQGCPSGDHYGPVSVGSPDERAEKSCRLYGKRIACFVKERKNV